MVVPDVFLHLLMGAIERLSLDLPRLLKKSERYSTASF